jgi:small subunit ribosomal protein S15
MIRSFLAGVRVALLGICSDLPDLTKGSTDMSFSAEDKTNTIKEYATFEGDTGSTQVQVAVLTLNANKKDKHGQRGLQVLVGKRNSLTKYLRTKDYDAYRKLIERLGIRR